MHFEAWGAGPRVVLVHGAITNGPAAWSKQRVLGERWQLTVVNRPGFFPNPPEDRCDFEADAAAIARLLGGGAHLVGHSYGDTLAAAAFPKLVVSGGHSPMQETLCDVLAEGFGPSAGRVVMEGAGHMVQRAPAFNDRLESFLVSDR